MRHFHIFLFFFLCGWEYTIAQRGLLSNLPEVKFEAYHIGFSVSIEDEPGIVSFTVYGNLNEKPIRENLCYINWKKNISSPIRGRWTFEDKNFFLRKNDKVYFWIRVKYISGETYLEYYQKNVLWIVKEYVEKNDSSIREPPKFLNEKSTPVNRVLPKPQFVAPNSECRSTVTKSSTTDQICGGQLLYERVFFNQSKEALLEGAEVYFPSQPDYPFVVYTDHKENLYVKDGLLFIKPTLLENYYGAGFVQESLDLGTRCTGAIGTSECSEFTIGANILPPIISAKVSTKNSFNFMYGKVEVIAKLPEGDWIYPEILLEPKDYKYGVEFYDSGIMRIAHVKGNAGSSRMLYAGLIMCDRDPHRQFGIRKKEANVPWNKSFHNYTLVWEPESVTVFVDGEAYGKIVAPEGGFESVSKLYQTATVRWRSGTKFAPFDQFFYVSVAVNVAGINDFPDNAEKSWKNRAPNNKRDFWDARNSWITTWHDEATALQVQSIRVYAL